MEIDTRFLSVHPRTALWWQQREQCRSCKHHSYAPDFMCKKGGTRVGGEKCAVIGSAQGPTTCISARDEGFACGPDANLFEPKEAA